MATIDDLKEAFADESQASVRYLTFARKAREEGHEDVARLFEDAAMDELCHAQHNLELMQGISSTENNLQSAINGEAAEYINKYPEYIEKALEENNMAAVKAFKATPMPLSAPRVVPFALTHPLSTQVSMGSFSKSNFLSAFFCGTMSI